MANGWGGRRPGSGPKRAAKKAAPPRAEQKALPAEPKAPSANDGRQLLASLPELIAASEKYARRNTVRTPELNPFKLPAFPKNAIPRDKSQQMAMDSNTEWAASAWTSGELLNTIATEGIAFPGYTYLSELAQRPEYRTISETIADDATRKFIKIEVAGSEDEEPDPEERIDGGEPGPEDKQLMEKLLGGNDEERFDAVKQITERDNRKLAERPGALRDPEETEDRIKAAGKLDKVKALKDEMERLKFRDVFYTLCRDDGLFGRSHMYLKIEGDEARDEINTSIGDGRNEVSRAKVGKGGLQAIRTVEPVWSYPLQYNATNPLREDWYHPQQWYVLGQQVHESRLVPVVGRPVPDILKPAYAFGGVSLSQLAMPYVDIWLQTRQSVANLIHSFSVMVLMTDLQTILQPGNAAGLIARAALFNALRDNQGIMMINKSTEDFKNVSAALSGLHELQAQAQEHVASIARIPLVKYTGLQPAGLNASDEGGIRVYYDTITAYQNRVIRRPATIAFNFMQLSLFGEVDPELTIEFEPLWEMSYKEKGEQQKNDAERHEKYVNMGAISAEEVRQVIVDDPELPYTGLNPEDVPEPPQQPGQEGGGEGEGEEGGGGGPSLPQPVGGGPPKPGKPPAGDRRPRTLAQDAAEWNEDDHPRGKGGKFAKGGGSSGGGGSSQKLTMPQYGLKAAPQAGHEEPWWKSAFEEAAFAKKHAPLARPAPKGWTKAVGGDPHSPDTIVFFSEETAGPDELNGIKFESWTPPDDDDGWANVEGQADLDEEPIEVPEGKQAASGVIVREPDGRYWIVKPVGGFGGYRYTFPKGRLEEGLSPQANAIKEAYEETGLKVKILEEAGDFEGDVTVTRYYIAEREGGDPLDAGEEAAAVTLVPHEHLDEMFNRSRDRKIAKSLAGDEFKESDHPRDPDGKFTEGSGSSGGEGESVTKAISETFLKKNPKAAAVVKNAKAVKPFLEAVSNQPEGADPATSAFELLDVAAEHDLKPFQIIDHLTPAQKTAIKNTFGTVKNALAAAKGAAQQKAAAGESKPLLSANLTKVGAQKGSNQGGVYKDSVSGKEFYVKKLKSPQHVTSERIAAQLAGMAGVNTLKYADVGDQPDMIATEMAKLEKDNVSKLSPEERKEAQKAFVANAWLANWDAAGTGGDNQGVVDGKVTTLDFGGSLDYRAQGEPKGAAFGNQVTELKTMVDPSKSPDAAKLFGSMTHAEMKESAKHVTDLTNDQIIEAVKAGGGTATLAEKMIARKNDIASKFGLTTDHSEWDDSKHPRNPDGTFAKGTGGEEQGSFEDAIKKVDDFGRHGGAISPLDAAEKKLEAAKQHGKDASELADVLTGSEFKALADKYGSLPKAFKGEAKKKAESAAKKADKMWSGAKSFEDAISQIDEAGLDLPVSHTAEQKVAAALELDGIPDLKYGLAKQEYAALAEKYGGLDQAIAAIKKNGPTPLEAGGGEAFHDAVQEIDSAGGGAEVTAEKKIAAALEAGASPGDLEDSLTEKEMAHLVEKHGSVENAMGAGGEPAEAATGLNGPLEDAAEAKLAEAIAEGDYDNAIEKMTAEEYDALLAKHGSMKNAVAALGGQVEGDPEGSVAPAEVAASTTAEAGSSSLTGMPAPAEPGKKSAFGGLWKDGGAPLENLQKNVDAVLSKKTNAGVSYQQMLAFMMNKAGEAGLSSVQSELKAKLIDSLGLAAEKHQAAGNVAELKKIDKMLTKLGAPQKGEGAGGGVELTNALVDAAAQAAAAKKAPSPSTSEAPAVKGKASTEIKPTTPAQMAEKIKAKLAQPAAAAATVPKTKATEAELAKAKKSVALQPQYVPGFADVPEGHKLLKAFNDKYAGKTLTDPAALEQKVHDFKQLAENMKPLQSAAQKAAAEKQAAAQAETAKIHAEALKDPGFAALAGVVGMTSAKSMVNANHTYISTAKKHGVTLTPVDAGLINHYVGSGYADMNIQLYSGVLTPEQYSYRKQLEKALAKMPTYEGTVHRGLKGITAAQFAKYKAGHVVPSPAFMSAGKQGKLWGDYELEIKGKSAHDISMLNGEGGGEVIFPPHTAFKVVKVVGKKAYLEEID